MKLYLIGQIRLLLKALNIFQRVKELESRVYFLRKATYLRLETGHTYLDVKFNHNRLGTKEIVLQLVDQLGFEIVPECDFGNVIIDRLILKPKSESTYEPKK